MCTLSDYFSVTERVHSKCSYFRCFRFAFLEFKNEKAATKNYALLEGKTINKATLVFDFMGEKSKTNTKTVRPIDPGQTRLLVASEMPSRVEDVVLLFTF